MGFDRILFPCVLALLCTQAPMASATSPSLEAHAVTGSWHVPAINVGDAGRYERSIITYQDGQTTTVDPPRIRESFQVLPPAVAGDANGHLAWSANIRLVMDTPSLDLVFATDDAGNVRSVMSTQAGSGLSPDGSDHYAYTTLLTNYQWQGMAPLCGWQSALQGKTVLTGQGLRLFPNGCRRAFYTDHGSDWVAVRTDAYGNGQALAFQPVVNGTAQPLWVWFANDIPYPVRFLEQTTSTPPTFAVMDLVGFQRGNQPMSLAPDDHGGAPTDPPGLQWTDNPRWGPTDTHADWPFPDALVVAKKDSQVADFLQAHAGAYVANANFNRYITQADRQDGTGTDHNDAKDWFVTFDDGTAQLDVTVAQTTTWKESSLPLGLTGGSPTTTSSVVQHNSRQVRTASIGSLPARMPAAQSVAAWWNAYAPDRSQQPGKSTAQAFFCDVACTTHRPGQVRAGAILGLDWVNGTTPVANGNWEGLWQASYLAVGDDGRAQFMVDNVNHEAGASQPVIAASLGRSMTTSLSDLVRDLLGSAPTLPAPPALPGHLPALEQTSPQSSNLTLPDSGKSLRGTSATKEFPMLPVAATAATVAGVAGIGLALRFLVVPLFSRLRRARVLDHATRALLWDLISENPGIHLQELMRRSGQAAGGARHHLAKLVEARLIDAVPEAGYVCYYPREHGGPRNAAATKSPGAQQVLQAIQARPGVSPAQLAQATRLAPGTVDYHVRRLRASGVVAAQKRSDGGVGLWPRTGPARPGTA